MEVFFYFVKYNSCRLNNTFIIVLVFTSVIESRLPDAGKGLMFHSTFEDNEDILVCTLEGDLVEIGQFRWQKDRRLV